MIQENDFKEIQDCKKLGRTINQTAKFTGLTYPTVKKYWEMSRKQFNSLRNSETKRKQSSRCDEYRNEIIELLKDVPERNSANIYDHIIERHPEAKEKVSERVMRGYVQKIRKEEGIPKTIKKPRDYQAVSDFKPGEQVQVDFGELKVRREDDPGKRATLYFILFTCRYSRYKYVEWREGSFSAREAVQAHLNAFDYFGGVPEMLVYDQDKRFITKETKGYLEYTEVFEAFIASMPFKIFVANKADPETKGQVETYVKFVKNNFARGRLYKDLETWQKECLSWLERTGNGKICQATNKTPTELFLKEEQQALMPYVKTELSYIHNPMITYSVNKDNTITYRKSRYRVPKGTYNNSRDHKVLLKRESDTLSIYDYETGELLVEHPVNHGSPAVVGEREPSHLSDGDRQFLTIFLAHLMDYRNGLEFAQSVCEEYPRHFVKQLKEINRLLCRNKELDQQTFEAAFTFCLQENKLAASLFEEVLESLKEDKKDYSFEADSLQKSAWQFSCEELMEMDFITEVIQTNRNESGEARLIRLSTWTPDEIDSPDMGKDMKTEDREHELLNQNKLKQLSRLTLGS